MRETEAAAAAAAATVNIVSDYLAAAAAAESCSIEIFDSTDVAALLVAAFNQTVSAYFCPTTSQVLIISKAAVVALSVASLA